MSTQLKTHQIKEAINRILDSQPFIGNVPIPTQLILNNEEPGNSFNVIPVDSKEQAEEIAMNIINSKNIKDDVEDYDKPIYLTVIVSLPR